MRIDTVTPSHPAITSHKHRHREKHTGTHPTDLWTSCARVLSEAEDPTKAVSVVLFRLHTAWKAVEIVSGNGYAVRT